MASKDVHRRLTPEEIATQQAANLAVIQAAEAKPSRFKDVLVLAVGALVVALIATGIWAANRVDKDCQKVAGGQGQTLNVCVDEHGNLSDGDR